MTVFTDNPAVSSFDALLPRGVESLPAGIVAALRRDDYSEALKIGNAAYSKSQGRDLVDVLVYAILLTHRELGEEALGVLRRGLGFHSDDVALQLAQVDALFSHGEYDAATNLMEALRGVPLTNARHWAYLGDMFWDVEARADALYCYEQASVRGSDAPDVALRLADLYADDERFFESAEQFERAGRLAPSDPHIWMAVTEAWLGLEEWERAVHAAQRAAKLSDDEPETWSLLGVAHREAGDLGAALQAFEKARNLDPDDVVHLQAGVAPVAQQAQLGAQHTHGRVGLGDLQHRLQVGDALGRGALRSGHRLRIGPGGRSIQLVELVARLHDVRPEGLADAPARFVSLVVVGTAPWKSAGSPVSRVFPARSC